MDSVSCVLSEAVPSCVVEVVSMSGAEIDRHINTVVGKECNVPAPITLPY